MVPVCALPSPRRPSAAELLTDRFIRSAKKEDLVALLPGVGEVGPDTAAALSDKPGYEAAGMVRPADSKFAEGTTWVLWKGSGSVTISAGAEVQPSAVSDDMFEAALSSMGEGPSRAGHDGDTSDRGKSIVAAAIDDEASSGSGAPAPAAAPAASPAPAAP